MHRKWVGLQNICTGNKSQKLAHNIKKNYKIIFRIYTWAIWDMFSKTGALSLSPYKGVFPYTELPTRVLMNLLLAFNAKSLHSLYTWELFSVEICKYYRKIIILWLHAYLSYLATYSYKQIKTAVSHILTQRIPPMVW